VLDPPALTNRAVRIARNNPVVVADKIAKKT
jgi:hypothetical protein